MKTRTFTTKNSNNDLCFCDPISGLCQILNKDNKNKIQRVVNYNVLKNKEYVKNSEDGYFEGASPALKKIIKTHRKIVINETEDKIIIKNLLAFRGDFEQKAGIVYDQNMVKKAAEQYKNAIKTYPYYRYMLDGHVDSDTNVPDSYRNVIGYVQNLEIDDAHKALQIDFAIFKNHPVAGIIKNCIDNDLPIGVSVVIVSSDAYRITRKELKQMNPEVVFLYEAHPELAELYRYDNNPEVVYYTGDGFIIRIDVVQKPAFETHTKSIEQGGVIKYNSAIEPVNEVAQTGRKEVLRLQLTPRLKENKIFNLKSEKNYVEYFKALIKDIDELQNLFKYYRKEYNIPSKILQIDLLFRDIKALYTELANAALYNKRYIPQVYTKYQPNIYKYLDSILSRLITFVGKNNPEFDEKEVISSQEDLEEKIKKLFEQFQGKKDRRKLSDIQQVQLSDLILFRKLIQENQKIDTKVPREHADESELGSPLIPEIPEIKKEGIKLLFGEYKEMLNIILDQLDYYITNQTFKWNIPVEEKNAVKSYIVNGITPHISFVLAFALDVLAKDFSKLYNNENDLASTIMPIMEEENSQNIEPIIQDSKHFSHSLLLTIKEYKDKIQKLEIENNFPLYEVWKVIVRKTQAEFVKQLKSTLFLKSLKAVPKIKLQLARNQ